MESNPRPKHMSALPLDHRGITIGFVSKTYFMFKLIFGH